jgi:hypothetical protein
MRKWNRTGVASTFGEAAERNVGWTWEIKRAGFEARYVRVEVEIAGSLRATDLPEEARHAIRSRGATAVDLFLDQENPPERIVVSPLGIRLT